MFSDVTYLARLSLFHHVSLLALVLPVLGGCAFVHSTKLETGNPIDPNAVQRIVIGKSTRSEIFNTFGTPHSIFQNQVEFRTYQALSAPGGHFEYADTRTLTTWSDKHYGVLYRSGTATSITGTVAVVVVTVGGTRAQIRTRELLLFFDKQTNVVEEVAYTRATD